MNPFRTVEHTSGTYPVWVGRGLIDSLGKVLARLHPFGGIVLLSADGLGDEWRTRLERGLNGEAVTIPFPDSEERKTLGTAEEIISAMLREGVRRDWIAVVAGGGSAGDTGGFAASIFMRGIRYVHVPTTLLAQVDSSLGGKLGVNHAAGKNLIGVFAAPSAVVSDLETLSTLPRRQIRSGLYEALKGGVLGDRHLFELMEERVLDILEGGEAIDQIVRRAIDVKIEIVQEDEREGDKRRLLNYGHTIGHGFEAVTGYAVLTHGDAVAWGMIAANAIARQRTLIPDEIADRIDRAILAYGPEPLPEIDLDELIGAIGHDKKFARNRRVMVFPVEIGECRVFDDVTQDEIAFGARAAVEASRGYDARA